MESSVKDFVLFSDLSEKEFAAMQKYCVVKDYLMGDQVLKCASPQRTLFVVVSGAILSGPEAAGRFNKKEIAYRTGDFFGEISLCTGVPMDGNCTAEEGSTLLLISEDSIRRMIAEDSVLAVKFVSKLLSLTIKRLRGVSRFFADIVQWGENASRRVITDELTGVYNRLFLDDVLESFFNISKSNGKPLSLFMLDLDNFSKINEKVGTGTGNTILCTVVDIIKESISRHGIIARYGGDEFSILLPETGLEKAIDIAEQIRGEVENRDFSDHALNEKFAVTISIGISAYPDTVSEIAAFKEKADASLYEAKRLGRNRVAYIA